MAKLSKIFQELQRRNVIRAGIVYVVGAWLIVQIDKQEYKSMILNHLEEFDQRKYGNTLLVFYESKVEQ